MKIVVVALISFICGVAGESGIPGDDIVRDVVLEHSLNSQQFEMRGAFEVSQTTKLLEGSNTIADVTEFKELIKSNGLYYIRAKTNPLSSTYVTVSIPACELQKSGFKEEITLHYDTNGNLVGMNYVSPVIALKRPCDASKLPSTVTFTTKFKFAETVLASSPPAQINSGRPPHLKDVKLGAEELATEKPANQSFLVKYWYIVVPMVLFTLFGGGGEPEKTPEGAAGADGKSQGAATTSGTAPQQGSAAAAKKKS